MEGERQLTGDRVVNSLHVVEKKDDKAGRWGLTVGSLGYLFIAIRAIVLVQFVWTLALFGKEKKSKRHIPGFNVVDVIFLFLHHAKGYMHKDGFAFSFLLFAWGLDGKLFAPLLGNSYVRFDSPGKWKEKTWIVLKSSLYQSTFVTIRSTGYNGSLWQKSHW